MPEEVDVRVRRRLEELVARERLYPSVILHGVDWKRRVAAAVVLCRALLCERRETRSDDCDCRHCRRIRPPRRDDRKAPDVFHPDVVFLRQDLATVTSTDATRAVLRTAQVSPFEARGQAFVVTDAETLSDEAANVLLKILEEPPTSAPRHFFLLCPSADRLLPTLRSRSLSAYLGPVRQPDAERVAAASGELARLLDAYRASRSSAYLLAAAALLTDDRADPRDSRPWEEAAAVVLTAYRDSDAGGDFAARLLDLAEDLLQAVDMRSRGIRAGRIVEGLISRHLAAAR